VQLNEGYGVKYGVASFGLRLSQRWLQLGPRWLPFADAATSELPLRRLLRLSLFQVSVGMSMVLLTGTLNRVMILELGVSAGLVALMVALPLLFAPFRALLGFRSDTHRSWLGWRRVPFLWVGTLLQFGGLAIMPFALIILSGDTHGPQWVGQAAAALAFLLVGAGMHTVQTAGLALATDLAPERARPRVVALLYTMLLIGMLVSALGFSALLTQFSQLRLIQVIQGAALATLLLNISALWQQEPRRPDLTRRDVARPRFMDAWSRLASSGRTGRFLLATALGTAAFTMQDVLLEPYGGEVLGLAVSQTTALTALLAAGTLAAFALAARALSGDPDANRLAAYGAVVGLFAFAAIIFSAPLHSALLFQIGLFFVGLGGGLFAVGSMTAAMDLNTDGHVGLALGTWGAAQATAAGLATAAGGVIRDVVSDLATRGELGAALATAATGYSVVYHIEIALLFATLIVIGPLTRPRGQSRSTRVPHRLGLAGFPG
jgi:BCD family chlorophyll transporter-like MFS transporter